MLGSNLSVAMYIIMVLLSSILFGIAQKKESENKTAFICLSIVAIVILTVPVAFRTCGADLDGYREWYDAAKDIGCTEWLKAYNSSPEPLYALLNAAIVGVGLDYRWITILCALLSVSLLWMGVIRLRKYTNIAICSLYLGCTMYIFLFGLNRIGLAVAMVSFAMKYFIERNPLKYFICILLAIGFHYTATLMIPLYIIINCFEKIKIWIYAFLVLTATFFGVVIMSKYRTEITSVLPFFGRYLGFFDKPVNIRLILNEAINFVLWLLILITCMQKQVNTREEIALCKLSITSLAIIIAVLGTDILQRLTYYIYPANAILYGVFANKIKSGQIKVLNINSKVLFVLYCGGMIAMTILWIYNMTTINQLWSPLLVPYTFS